MGAYDLDFHAWALAQADAIRRRSANELDWENLAEELESLGRSQRHRLESHLRVLEAHLLKWQFQPDERRTNSWRATIVEQRRQIARLLEDNPSLRPHLAAAFDNAYPGALVWAAQETRVQVEENYPDTPPFSVQQALEAAWPPSLVAWEAERG